MYFMAEADRHMKKVVEAKMTSLIHKMVHRNERINRLSAIEHNLTRRQKTRLLFRIRRYAHLMNRKQLEIKLKKTVAHYIGIGGGRCDLQLIHNDMPSSLSRFWMWR